ncbi:MAG: hypothetical protein H8Z69_03555 [Nanohaloarchaea archaeon]|nr:hypothetical protein [Candidatus Nanohaloarchaea archaeon]
MNKKISLLLFLSILVSGGVSADTFGSTEGTLPNVTQVSVHNVTYLSEAQKETGGVKIDEGLNTTFELNQSYSGLYRFDFRITNEGGQSWELNESDSLFHDGLDNSWDVKKIWYNISQDYDSGTSNSGKVSWNTLKGGTLNSGEVMYAKYIVNISSQSSQLYDQSFEVNDSSNMSGSRENHQLNVTKLGNIDLIFEDPKNDISVTQNKTFDLNASISCSNGDCGTVYITPRYNESSTADTLISDKFSKPFYLTGSSEKSCALSSGESCSLSWDVNSTGERGSFRLLDINSSSSYSKIDSQDSPDKLVEVTGLALINLGWSSMDFGALSPGTEDNPALNNSDGYEVSVPQRSNTVDKLWTKADPLKSNSKPNEYSIGAGNLSYSLTNDVSTETPLSQNYSLIDQQIKPGSSIISYFWLDIPQGLIQDDYTGKIYFKANLTG